MYIASLHTHECCSNTVIGDALDVRAVNHLTPNSNTTMCYAIPQRGACNGTLSFVWPAREKGRSCACPAPHFNLSNSSMVFESCVRGCRDTALTPVLTRDDSICISNLRSSLNGSLFHFVCSTNPCASNCFLQTVISSHIFLAGNHYVHIILTPWQYCPY